MGDGEDGEGRKGRHFPRKQNVPAAEKLENCTLFMFDEVEKTVFLMSLTKPLTPGLGCEAIEALQRAGAKWARSVEHLKGDQVMGA